LDYSQWLGNYHQAVEHRRHSRQVRIDFTLTLPGLFDIENIVALAQDTNSEILAKVVFSFGPDIILSPLALPRQLLDAEVDRLTKVVPPGAMRDVLTQLKTRPNFEEQWPDTYRAGLAKGKQRVLQLESIRKDTVTLDTILQPYTDIHAWYQSIA
jgi:hypothetical protein